MSNNDIYEKSKGVILSLLDNTFPNTLDIDIFYIEESSSERVLKNYDDVTSSWDKGFSAENNSIENELLLYRETIRFLTSEKLITHQSDDDENRRTYNKCKITQLGKDAINKQGASISDVAILKPAFMGVGLDLKKGSEWLRSFRKRK